MKITDERLAEMVGAGVPCVPAQPGEVAAVVQELRTLRAASIPAPEHVPLPDELEVAIKRAIARLQNLHDYAGRPTWERVLEEELGAMFSQAHSALAVLRAEVDRLTWQLEVSQTTVLMLNGVIDRCRKDASAAEAEVKRLTEEKEAKAGVEHVETLSELLKIIKEHWIDYDHVFSIAVDEADKFVSSQALSGSKE